MPTTYQNPVYDYVRSPDQEAERPAYHPVIIVGAGPIGLAVAADLAVHGQRTVLLDDSNTVSVGSRAICFAKRTLEIFDRLGCGQRMVDKGVTWNVGRVFFGDREVYSFDLLPEQGHKRPAFINLQQYYVEEYLVDRVRELGLTDLRWKNRVIEVDPRSNGVRLEIDTPDGPYTLECDYLIAADGARSPIRGMLGLQPKGQTFQDRFLIADVVMKAEFPAERWFWFNPPFHEGQSTLLHKQADNVWRIDFQLGWEADPEREKQPERVIPRIKAMLGENVPFDLEWISVYTFRCERLERFRHGRVIFAGDSAHLVSPFGARGANSGIQDADNLVWKLRLVMQGKAPESLLDSYDAERIYAADENILNSTRSTDFITPKTEVSRAFRDAVLMLAEHYPFARRLVNSGRLSVPAVLTDSPLNTPDGDRFAGAMMPGTPCTDAPVITREGAGWLIDHLGNDFTGLYFAGATTELRSDVRETLTELAADDIPVRALVVGENIGIGDPENFLTQRYDGRPETFYLIRPDQHVAGRWRRLNIDQVRAAVARTSARQGG